MKQTFTVLLFLKTSKINSKGKAPIYVRVTVNGKRSEMSIKHLLLRENISYDSSISEITFLRYWNEIELDKKGKLKFNNNEK